MKTSKNLNVAVVTHDLKLAGRVCSEFKKLNILVHSFESASDFLSSLESTQYDLSLIDIADSKVGNETLALDSRLSSTSLAFIFTIASSKYLGPTYTTDHLGYVDATRDLTGQLKNILFNYKKKMNLISEFESYKSFHANYAQKSKGLHAQVESLKEKIYHQNIMTNFSKNFEKLLEEFNFSTALSKSLCEFDGVKNYALFKLNDSGTKLINLDLDGEKSLDIPSIWIGKNNDVGIGSECISVASGIVEPFVDETLLSITISKNNESSDMLLVLEILDSDAYALDWNGFESFLSGKYAQMINRLNDIKEDKEDRSIFHLLDDLSNISSGDHLIGLDISDIADVLSVKFDVSFNYLKFWSDLKTYCRTFFALEDIYIVDNSLIALRVSQKDFSVIFDSLKETFGAYDISKYFQGISKSEVMSLEIRVSEMPFSHFGLIEKKNEVSHSVISPGEMSL